MQNLSVMEPMEQQLGSRYLSKSHHQPISKSLFGSTTEVDLYKHKQNG